MSKRLEGRVAIVTGSGRGIGRAEALMLAAEGAKVIINDLGGASDGTGTSSSPADEVVAEIKKMGGAAAANYNSVATPEGGDAIIKSALDTFGRLDILVNNAGILRDRIIFNMTNEEWDVIMKVHLYGTFYCTRAACVVFRQQRYGRIINTSSNSGLGNLGQANYSAAKEAIVGFTRTVARDMGKYNVTCNAIRPFAGTRMTLTPEMRVAYERKGKMEVIHQIEASKPEDIAPIVAYLASEEAGGVNGATFTIRHGELGIFPDPLPVRTIFKDGTFTVDEIARIFPNTLGKGLINPAPPEEK